MLKVRILPGPHLNMPYFKLTKGPLSFKIESLKEGDSLEGKTLDGKDLNVSVGGGAKKVIVNGQEQDKGEVSIIFERDTFLEQRALIYLSRRKTRILKDLLLNDGPAGIQDGLRGLWIETEINAGLRKPDEGSLRRNLWMGHTLARSETLRTNRKE